MDASAGASRRPLSVNGTRTSRVRTADPRPRSAAETVRGLHQEHVVGRGGEETVQVVAELEDAGIRRVLALLRPRHVESRSRTPLPTKDRVDPYRLEVEVRLVERECGSGPRTVGIHRIE